MTRDLRASIIIGFAMFGLVCGAGNIMIPPVLGVKTGSLWHVSSIGFIFSDVVFSVIAMFILNQHGSLEALGRTIGVKFINLFIFSFMLIVLFIFVPRGAALSYELAIHPFFGIHRLTFYTIYYFFVVILCLNPSKIFDHIGSWMSPLLIFFIFYLIMQTLFHVPHYKTLDISHFKIFQQGFLTGYQTGDPLGAILPINLAISILLMKGFKNPSQRKRILKTSIIIFGIILTLSYVGLIYLGASLSQAVPSGLSTVETLRKVFELALGRTGIVLLAWIVFMACFTTAVGVSGMVADFFDKTYRIPYIIFLILASVLNIFLSSIGVDSIMSFAGPILELMYTAFILLMTLNLLKIESPFVFKATVHMGMTVTFLSILSRFGVSSATFMVKHIPLNSEGFSWIVPSVVVFFISFFISKKKKIKILKIK